MKKLITYLSKKSLSLGNGSGMTRKWFGNDSGMTRFSLASLICLCMLTVGVGDAWGDPVTIFKETFGDNGSCNSCATAVASASCYTASTTSFTTGHQTTVVENYSSEDGTKVSKNNVSSSDNSGASGLSHLYRTGAASQTDKDFFTIRNINISGYSSLSLKFNLFFGGGIGAGKVNTITVKYKIDSGTETTLTYTGAPTSNSSWSWCTGNISGTGNSLQIKFYQTTNGGYLTRIDDIILTGTAATPSCSAPAASTISGTASYTAGETITLTASHDGSNHSASTTYTWYKGADWATARAASPVQASATGSSGYTFTKTAVVGDAGTYWCEASNGSGCESHNATGKTITVSASCPTAPTVAASSNGTITCTSATINCNNGSSKGVVKGSCDISEWGFVYGTSSNPTGNKTSKGTSSSTDVANFSHTFTGLTPGQKYYVRAYAIVNGTTYYGDETNFTCNTITVTANNGSYGSVSGSGLSWTGSPNSGYVYASPDYTITAGNNTEVERTGNTFTITSTSTVNVTITINFEAKGCSDHADEDLTNGASSGDDYGPIHPYYSYSVSQILYTRDDLGLSASTKKGTIKSIYFEYSGASAMSDRSIVIYMANTSQDALATDDYVPYSVFTKVYEGTFGCSSTGWYEIEFDTEFKYDGLGNLVVMIDDNTGSYQDDKNFKSHSASGMQIYQRRDGSDIDPRSWSPATAPSYRPNTKFCIQEEDMEMYTVSFSTGTGNDGVSPMTEEDYGEGILLPNGPTPDCADDGWVFAGWSETEYTTEPYVTNVGRLRMPGDYFYPDDDVTLYAVYRKLTSGTSTATYTANSRGNLSVIGAYDSEYWWYHTATGVEFYINNYGIYEDKFDIYNSKGSDNNGWAVIDAHRPITSISFTKTSSDDLYASLSSTEPGAGTVTLDGSTITCTGSVTKVVLETSTDQYSDVMLSTFTVTYKNCKFLSNPSCCTKHDITLASSGSVTGGTFTTSAASACEGAEVTLTATPSDGYAFAGWTVTNTSGGADVTDAVLGAGHAGDNPATMTMPEQAVTVNATFATLTGITVKTAPTKTTYCEGDYFDPTGLVITASFSNSTSLDIPYAGNEAKFTFSPTTSTALTTGNSSVSISYGGQSTSQAITVNAHRTISLTGSGTVTGGTFTADESSACVGATITIEVSAADHYSFNSWTIEKAGGGTVTPVSATSASTTFIMPDANVTVTASFNEDAYKTVCFKNNGVGIAGYTTQKVYVGESPTAPTLTDGYGTGDACDETSDKHYGWTQETWTSTIANKSTIDARTGSEAVYAKNANLPTVAAEDPSTIYYHAVWAEGTAAPTINTTLIAKWDKQEIEASTSIKAKDASGNTLNSVLMSSNKSFSSSGTYTYNNSSVGGSATITISGLSFSSYSKGSISFYTRQSNSGTWQIQTSSDGSTYSDATEIGTPGSNDQPIIYANIPNTTTHIKLLFSGASNGLNFGTVRIYGVTTSPTYDFVELTSSNTSGWSGSDWEGYYLITGNSSAKALRSDGIDGYSITSVTASSNKITTGDVGLIFKATYSSGNGYVIQGVASGDYINTNKAAKAYQFMTTSQVYLSSINYNDILLSTGNHLQWNSTFFGVYSSMTSPTLYKIMSSFSTFRTTCCTTYDITLDGGGTISGAGTFSAGVDAACATETITLTKDICDGYTVGDWTVYKTDDESTTVTVTSNQFTMPAYGVTVKLATTAKVDHFKDKLHKTTGYTGDGYAVSGCNQTVPNLSDQGAPADESCKATHYKFVGWVDEDHVNSDGTLKSGYTIVAGGTTSWNASGTTYIAIWGVKE